MIAYADDLNTKIVLDNMRKRKVIHQQASKNILLIGNGFDIRTGLKSSFSDFFIYISYACVLYKCVKGGYIADDVKLPISRLVCSAYSKQLGVLINDLDKKTYEQCYMFSTSVLGELIFKHLFSCRFGCSDKFFDDIVRSVFESDALPIMKDEQLNIVSIGELLRNKFGNIDKVLGLAIKTLVRHVEQEFANIKGNIKLWVDVESVIEMIITRSEDLKDKYNFKEDIKRDYSSSKSFLYGLELFEILLAKYLKSIQSIDITEEKSNLFFENIRDKFSQSAITRSFKRIKNLDISHPDVVINYNYTDIAERYFEAIGHKPEFFYVNGSLDAPEDLLPKEICTNIVVGYTNSNNVKVNKELFPFEKKSRRIIKNTQYIDIDQIINKERFDLVIMGHSCGIADSDVFKKLLSSEYLKTALVLCHSTDDLISSFNNIRAMVGEEKFSELMTFEKEKITNNLYFAVENLEEQTDYLKDNKCEER